MTPSATPRIDGIVARAANVAVVFRRGPSRWTQLLMWDLDSDVVTPGQWINGRVYTDWCDLSPNGELLVTAITNHSARAECARVERGEHAFPSWTAISRPPYFTALAVWQSAGTYFIGGMWPDDRTVALDLHPEDDVDPAPVPARYRVERLDPEIRSDQRQILRLVNGGWKVKQTLEKGPRRLLAPEPALTLREGVTDRRFSGGRLVRRETSTHRSWHAIDDEGNARLGFHPEPSATQWLDLDHRGRVIYGDAGCLWAWENFPRGAPKLIADLGPNQFEEVAAPDWAREWPE